MRSLEFEAVTGKDRKKVKLAELQFGADYFQLYVDGFFLGQIFKKDGYWIAYFNDLGLSELTGDDIYVLGSLVEDFKNT